MKSIGYLGAGTWGFCLASLLATKGHKVTLWTRDPDMARHFQKTRSHPKLAHFKAHPELQFTSDISEAVLGAEILVESVTSMGLRPVLKQVADIGPLACPLIITSKGIEQDTCLLLPEVVVDIFGDSSLVGCLTGPSHAEEVIQKLPTSIVSTAYHAPLMHEIHDLFSTPYLRIYPNSDIHGVCFGGAMKNIIAIACGISDGLGFGDNTKAALMTRGLHEIRKLSVTKGAKPETLNGLSGMGDLCVTCLSRHSRNSAFGRLLGQGLSATEAKEKIGMVIEGAFTCVSARQLAHKAHIDVPITEAVYSILYEGMNPRDAVKALLQRAIKEEHL
ncbi:MAG: NAD(P)-dependent glycerol-3-phosphate dehydrogenase [Verrucomicrobia bacterium]|nr:NAD(P)-dependent glycerol-3-phosphate dehydrogenase [Verrucomicrobiota bacterium]